MGHDWVASADYLGIIPALIEHTHVHTQVVGKVYGAVHGALVRADDH